MLARLSPLGVVLSPHPPVAAGSATGSVAGAAGADDSHCMDDVGSREPTTPDGDFVILGGGVVGTVLELYNYRHGTAYLRIER